MTTTTKFQAFNAKNSKWTTLVHKEKGDRRAYDKAINAGKPIRVLHPNGSFKVIKNGECLPKGEETRFAAA